MKNNKKEDNINIIDKLSNSFLFKFFILCVIPCLGINFLYNHGMPLIICIGFYICIFGLSMFTLSGD